MHERHRVDAGASVFMLDVRSRVEGRIVEVSKGGCSILLKNRFPTGVYRRVEVEFRLDGLPFRLSGVVQSIHDRFTIGIRLLEVSERKREQLTILITELEEAKRQKGGANKEPRGDAP